MENIPTTAGKSPAEVRALNELQKTELDLLIPVVEICRKLDLTYYLVCGSVLGAAKYQGFIPWDDDMDVGLPRPDYERFLQAAPALLPEGYFLQNYRTDPAFPHVFSKLRDSNTTLIEHSLAHLDMNHGVCIDIFPLDGYPARKWEQKVFELRKKVYSWMQYCALGRGPDPKVEFRNRIFRLLGYHKRTAKTLAKMDRLYSRYATEGSEVWCNHGNWQGKLEYAPRWHYGVGTELIFEGLAVQVPENYDAYLTQKYGDWRSDPPPEKQASHHSYKVCDVHRPYTDYQKREK